MLIELKIEVKSLTVEEKAMLERVLGPVANALVEALKPQLEAMNTQVDQANQRREQAERDFHTTNEVRITLQNEVTTLRETNSRLLREQDVLVAARDTAQANSDKWDKEVATLVADYDANLAKLRRERDEVKEELTKLRHKFGEVATRMHDINLLLGNI